MADGTTELERYFPYEYDYDAKNSRSWPQSDRLELEPAHPWSTRNQPRETLRELQLR